MPRLIPFTGQPQEFLNIALGGRKLRMRALYANLTDDWKLDVFDATGPTPVALVAGVAIVMGADIIKPYRLGIGGIYAEPMADPRDDAGRGELGNRIRLVHYTQDELDALEAA